MRLSDSIESFIKMLMEEGDPQVELKRNELAEYFGCAPSQINYVLATRFSPEQGYVIESRRGGGGYIRIVRVMYPAGQQMMQLINTRIGDSISEGDARRIISQLAEREVLSNETAQVMVAAISGPALAVPMPETMKDALRARMMRSMLTAAARVRQNDEQPGQ